MECRKCGQCCRNLIIEIEHLDIIREPKLLKVVELLDGHGKEPFENDEDKVYLLACGASYPCKMLKNNQCSIYPTRPSICVSFEAGSEQCNEHRLSKPKLENKALLYQ